MKKNNDSLFRGFYDKKTVERINKKISLLGYNCKYDAYTFLSIRLITSILLFILVLVMFTYGYIFSIMIVVIYYYLFCLNSNVFFFVICGCTRMERNINA